jgi:uncharacterized membrane protein (UPF0127 family)
LHLFREEAPLPYKPEQHQWKELQDLIRFTSDVTPRSSDPLHAQVYGRQMTTRTYCVYNQTRECFLSLSVTPADTTFARLKGLIGRLRLKVDEGLWIVPSCGVHTVGVLFPLDIIYLDESHRVIHIIEHFPRFRIAPLRTQASSVLELPTHTIYTSQTQPGDQLLICAVEEIANRFNKGGVGQLKRQSQELDPGLDHRTAAQEADLYETNHLGKH